MLDHQAGGDLVRVRRQRVHPVAGRRGGELRLRLQVEAGEGACSGAKRVKPRARGISGND
jgi:hypothetical protein